MDNTKIMPPGSGGGGMKVTVWREGWERVGNTKTVEDEAFFVSYLSGEDMIC